MIEARSVDALRDVRNVKQRRVEGENERKKELTKRNKFLKWKQSRKGQRHANEFCYEHCDSPLARWPPTPSPRRLGVDECPREKRDARRETTKATGREDEARRDAKAVSVKHQATSDHETFFQLQSERKRSITWSSPWSEECPLKKGRQISL